MGEPIMPDGRLSLAAPYPRRVYWSVSVGRRPMAPAGRVKSAVPLPPQQGRASLSARSCWG